MKNDNAFPGIVGPIPGFSLGNGMTKRELYTAMFFHAVVSSATATDFKDISKNILPKIPLCVQMADAVIKETNG